MGKKSEKTVLDYALEYAEQGLCVIPVPYGTKAARIKWGKYQKSRPDEKQLRKWFANDNRNIAVILNKVSGGLTVLDFDSMNRYEWWKEKYRDYAVKLPTVKTARGVHVYFRSKLIKSKKYDGIDLKATGYVLLPPSIHPDGSNYEWITLLNGELPLLDPFEWGLEQFNIHKPCSLKPQKNIADVTERTDENRGEQKRLELVVVNKKIREAISNTLPKEFRTRHRKIFDFARELYSMPEYTDADPKQFYNVVIQWHKKALPKIRTKEFEETWIDFLKAWPNIKHKIGDEPMAQIFEAVIQLEPPEIAVEKYPDNSKLKIFVSLCRELQRAAGNNPFYLATRTAGKLLKISPMQASRWFYLLETDNILKVVAKGGTAENPRKASRYRYIAN